MSTPTCAKLDTLPPTLSGLRGAPAIYFALFSLSSPPYDLTRESRLCLLWSYTTCKNTHSAANRRARRKYFNNK
jgi:hypothetical protein